MNGAITTALIWGVIACLVVHPPLPRYSRRFSVLFVVTWWVNELPIIVLWFLLLGAWPTLAHPSPDPWWWAGAVMSALVVLVLARLLLRARSDRRPLSSALEDSYGSRGTPSYTRPSWWRIVLLSFISWRPDVQRLRNRRYGPSPRAHRLDVYVSRQRRQRAPVLIYLHPGGFVMGSKRLGAHPLLYRLAARGWVCVSADYRLRGTPYAGKLEDTRAVLDWVREHADELGADPDAIFLSGGSAGAHLAATAALTGENVKGVIGMYGYYGDVGGDGDGPTAPMDCLTPDAPPFFVIHGALDTLVLREDARAFAERLAAVSRQTVTYAELPGANHNFDLFPSLRFNAVIDAIIRFTDLTLADRPVETHR